MREVSYIDIIHLRSSGVPRSPFDDTRYGGQGGRSAWYTADPRSLSSLSIRTYTRRAKVDLRSSCVYFGSVRKLKLVACARIALGHVLGGSCCQAQLISSIDSRPPSLAGPQRKLFRGSRARSIPRCYLWVTCWFERHDERSISTSYKEFIRSRHNFQSRRRIL